MQEDERNFWLKVPKFLNIKEVQNSGYCSSSIGFDKDNGNVHDSS